jgi:hypothetical protein
VKWSVWGSAIDEGIVEYGLEFFARSSLWLSLGTWEPVVVFEEAESDGALVIVLLSPRDVASALIDEVTVDATIKQHL